MARIQWTHSDFRTKGPIVNDVLSWKTVELDINRGTYRDTWPMLPFKMGSPIVGGVTTVSGQTMPDDGEETPTLANTLHSDFPRDATGTALWTSTKAGKIRVPDEIMHIAPRTRIESVVFVEFYSGAFTNETAAQTLLTSVTGVASTDIITKTAHGLVTGDLVKYVSGTGFAGYTAEDLFYVAKLSANTFYLCTSLANAYALTPANFTTDGSSGVLVKMSTTKAPTGDWRASVQLSEIVSFSFV